MIDGSVELTDHGSC